SIAGRRASSCAVRSEKPTRIPGRSRPQRRLREMCCRRSRTPRAASGTEYRMVWKQPPYSGEDVIAGDIGEAREDVCAESVDGHPSDLESEDRRQKKPSDVDPQLNPVLIGLCNACLSNTVVRSCHSTKGPF